MPPRRTCEHNRFAMLVLMFSTLVLRFGGHVQAQMPCARCTSLLPEENVGETVSAQQTLNTTDAEEESLLLIDLNKFASPAYTACETSLQRLGKNRTCAPLFRESVDGEFYINSLPDVGQLFQAYRPSQVNCKVRYPSSCQTCCAGKFTIFDPLTLTREYTCCAKTSDFGRRLFLVGEEITSVPSKVIVQEGGFVWYRPPSKIFSGRHAQAQEVPTRIEFRAEYFRSSSPPISPTTATDSGCAEDRALCASNATRYHAHCLRCSKTSSFNLTIAVKRARKYPIVGFGGHMIAFDGGDDFFVVNYSELPQYEFGIQFWFQQNKIREGQSLFTWWSARGREWEVADTSNIFYYHFNNKTQRTGVGVNDGRWHHLAFSWRLHCQPKKRRPGAAYCVQDVDGPGTCNINRDCTHVEISLIVDGVKRAESKLPAFLPSSEGEMVFGQSMQRPFKTTEVTLRDNFFELLRDTEDNITSNLESGFSDNQLQLMWSRIRSGHCNNSKLFEKSMSKQAREAIFCEHEPWREPYSKYCDHLAPGGFKPGAALSGNIDEFRIYDYYRAEFDVTVGMNLVINGADRYTFTPLESNWSLILYYTFDMKGNDFVKASKDDFMKWPLVIEDESPWDGGYQTFSAFLGGEEFRWAPLRVVSTAPIYGSRNIQIGLSDFKEPIPINLIDLQRDPDTPPSEIVTRIEEKARFGKLWAGADDCDSIRTVQNVPRKIVYRPQGCKGSVIGFFKLSGTTYGCAIGTSITTQPDQGMLANVTEVNQNGSITRIDMVSMGRGYDWNNKIQVNLSLSDATCRCLKPNRSPGNFADCYRPIISPAKADTSGAEFAGFDVNSGTLGVKDGLPVTLYPTCTGGNCPAVKPRPCKWACHRDVGWMTDVINIPSTLRKYTTGPFSEYAVQGFATAYWSNSRHTIWYVPENLRKANFKIVVNDKLILQDTIKDEFAVRFFDYLPSEFSSSEDPENPPPFVHLWVHFVYEKLAMPLNTSIIWEESSPVLIQLSFLDFDRGTAILNSPFAVYTDLPSNGKLYQAVLIAKEDNATEFERECVCPTKPTFPKMNRTLENTKYLPGTPLPGYRPCDVSSIGFFCYKKGPLITKNDSLITSTVDTMVVPGFQHARDGAFVIYEMGIEKSGTSQFFWRLKFPQGQVINATVNIQVRSVNNRPVALDASIATQEDTFKEVKLEAFDFDDARKPAMYITEFPAHGTLYQCNATNSSIPCRIGERISIVNESEPQWANVQVDPQGAINDEITAVLKVFDSVDPTVQQIIRNSPNTSTVLSHGYGFGSYNFDPDKQDNFRKLCGTRGSIAADLWLQSAMFVTNLDLFYPIRSDTPFRILAQRTRQFEYISYDYNTAGNVMQDVEVSQTATIIEGLNYEEKKDGIHFVDSGKWRAEQSFSYKRADCGHSAGPYKEQTVCQQIWDGRGYVRSEQRSTVTEEIERWFELFRGLPHHARAEHDRISPVFADTLFRTRRLRIEACGANMRIFGENSNFLENVRRVRVWGSKTQRPKGAITSLDRRVVYVPNYNYVGTDSFNFRVVDHGGGGLRSSSQFSLQRHWSPIVSISITVSARPDVPLATSIVVSQVLGTATSEVVMSTPGIHPGATGGSVKVTSFDIEITQPPIRGSVMFSNGNVATSEPVRYDGILKYRTPAVDGCGRPYDDFVYRIKNAADGDNRNSRLFKATIDLRCKTGYTCDLPSFKCKACPIGTYGDDSAIKNTCHLCPAGTYQSRTAAKFCTPCPPGSYNSKPGSEKCYVCPEGTYNGLEGQMDCQPCPGGTYGPFPGLLECRKCGEKHWTPTIASFSCKDCPINTRSRVRTALGIQNCECEHGYYNVHGKTGVQCHPCPHGAYCHGRNLLPVARTGYWTSQEIWTKDEEDMETGNMTWGHAHFAPCSFRNIRGVCIGYPDIDVQEQEERCQYRDHKIIQGPLRLSDILSTGIDVNISSCTLRDLSIPGEAAPEGLRSWIMRQSYAANSYCAQGYTGVICSKCSAGYYRDLRGYCFHCPIFYRIPVLNVLFFLIILVLNVAFWVCMFIASCHEARSLYILISHIQLMAMLGRLGVPWPDYVQGVIMFSSITNLNLDGIHWQCLELQSSFDVRHVMEQFIPIGIVFGFYFYYYSRVNDALSHIRKAEEAAVQASGIESSASRPLAKVTPAKPTTAKSGKSVAVVEAPNAADAANALDRASVTTQDDDSVVAANEIDADSGEEEDGSEKDEEEKQLNESLRDKQETGSRDVVRLLSPKEIRKLRDAGIWHTTQSLNLLFVMASSNLLIPFTCTKVSDTLHYLDWFPEFSCTTQAYSNFVFFSYVLGMGWIVVFPSLQIYILRKGWYNELVRDRLFIRQFGWLFHCYEVKYFWWEVAVLFRKAFIVGIINTLTRNTYTALLGLSVFLSIHLFWTFYMWPHIHERHNVVDLWLQKQFLLFIVYSLTNLNYNEGMKIVTTRSGTLNDNIRITLVQPEPDMDFFSDKYINRNWTHHMTFLIVMGFSLLVAVCMVLYDLYETRVKAPEWAPYLWNALFGCELWGWDEFVSSVFLRFDKLFTMVRDRKKVKPPERPASRWAHRVMMMDGVAKAEDFFTEQSVEAMLATAIASTQEEEWARDKESCIAYLRALDKRIFASEMHNSKAANLPILERERNLAKKRLISFLYEEGGAVFKVLYDQTGLNEQTLWEIQELERLRVEKAILETGSAEHKKHLLKQNEEQTRRIGSIGEWKAKYEQEMKQIKDLQKQVKQARDVLLLYHLEESDDSEEERGLDAYLAKSITNYIENKSVRDLVNEGRLEPQPFYQ